MIMTKLTMGALMSIMIVMSRDSREATGGAERVKLCFGF